MTYLNYQHSFNNAATSSINIISEDFEVDMVIVAFNWTTKNGVSYSINIHPSLAINSTGMNSAKLALSYNKGYDLSVTASFCERNETTIKTLNYGKVKACN